MTPIPHASLALALSTVALVPAVFGSSLPPLAEVHRSTDDTALATAQRSAVLTAGAVVIGVALAASSPTVAVAGLAAVLTFSLLYSHARAA